MARRYHRCPACGKVSYFSEGERIVCRSCRALAPSAQATADEAPPADAPSSPGEPEPQAVASSGATSATGMGIASLVLGLFALASVWVVPFSGVLALAAIVTGILAVTSAHEDEDAAKALGVIGIVLGGLLVVLALLVLLNPCFPWGCDMQVQSGGGHDGGGSGGGDGVGGGSGGTGGGDPGVGGGDGGTDAPGAGIWWTMLVLVLAGVRRR